MKISKRAQELAMTTALQNVRDLGTQVKGLLDRLTPMMQNLQQSVPEINNALQQIQQLETQVGQLEQIRNQVAQQAEQAKTVAPADDKPKDKLKGGVGDDVPVDKLNKKQLEMGKKVEMEHTSDPEIAEEITRDHLAEELEEGKEKEDQEYYTELETIHEDCNDVPAFWRRNLDYGERNG